MEIALNDKVFNITPENYSIESIIVFGSFIRGDNTDHSDIDFLIVVDNCTYTEKLMKKIAIAKEMDVPSSWLSINTIDEIYDLCLYGDSFLWSIKLQGMIFYSRSGFFEYCLYNLKVYTNMLKDIVCNYNKLKNINKNFIYNNNSDSALLNMIGYLVRNTLTIVAYTSGVISYNKYEVFDICSNIPMFKLPFSKEEYYNLLELKASIKDNSIDEDSIPNLHEYINIWIKKTSILLKNSLNIIIRLTAHGFISPFINYV